MPSLTADILLQLGKRFKQRTGTGLDMAAIHDVMLGTRESREHLAMLMRRSIAGLSWPMSTLVVLMFLLGKKNGGCRTIALMATYTRLIMAHLSDQFREWDQRACRKLDTAVKGRNAAELTAARHMEVEIQTLAGKWAAHLLWDGTKFYDQLDPVQVTESALKRDFPIVPLAMGMMAHRAPRILSNDGHFSRPVAATGLSTLPGCTISTSLARSIVADAVEEVHEVEGAKFYQHVDDLNQQHIHDTFRELEDTAVRMGTQIAAALRARNIEISDKTVVVACRRIVAKRIAKRLGQAIGLKLRAAGAADDLGVETAAGARRTGATAAKRRSKARQRARRVGAMARRNPQAGRLYATGVKPQGSFGACVQGTCPTAMAQHRRTAALAVAPPGRHCCTTTVLWWKLGQRHDPGISMVVDQITLFFALWNKHLPPRMRPCLQRQWNRFAPVYAEGIMDWKSVTGTMQATLLTLLGLGFDVNTFRCWKAPSGKVFNPVEVARTGLGPLLHEVNSSTVARIWHRASRRLHAGGLEHGPPGLAPAAVARAEFLQDDRHEHVKALDLVLCGGAWSPDGLRTCRCGLTQVTAAHFYWTCPKLVESSEPCIKDTLHLWDVIQEMDCLRHAECLWAHGMLPACMRADGRFSDEPVAVWSTPNFARALAAAGDVHPDGSGGPAWAAKRAPRAGAGAAVLDTARHSMHEDLFVVHDVALSGSNVTGRQTVPRAELQAILNVVGLLPQDMKQLHIHPDATYTANGLMPDKRELRQRMEHGTNADLWIQLKDLEGRLGLVLSGHRTPEHTSPDDLVEMRGPPVRDFLGNLLADAAAGASAKAALRAAPVDVRTAKRWEERAVAIARRLAHLEALRWAEGFHLAPDVDPHRASRDRCTRAGTFAVPTRTAGHGAPDCAAGRRVLALHSVPKANQERLSIILLAAMPAIASGTHACGDISATHIHAGQSADHHQLRVPEDNTRQAAREGSRPAEGAEEAKGARPARGGGHCARH